MAVTDCYTNYLRDKINDLVFGATAYTRPASTDFTLLTVMGTASGGGTAAAGFTAVTVVNNATNWPASSARLKTNGTDILFGNNSGSTVTIVGCQESDLGSPPNLITFFDFITPILLNNGDAFQVSAGLGTFTFKGTGYTGTYDATLTSCYSDYLVNKINDHLHGGSAFSPPGTVYLELVTAIGKTDGSSGTAAPGFSRLAVTNNATNWPASSGQTKTNGTSLAFGTNGGATATITGVRVWDASTLGNMLTLNLLSTPAVVAASAPFAIPVGAQVFGWAA